MVDNLPQQITYIQVNTCEKREKTHFVATLLLTVGRIKNLPHYLTSTKYGSVYPYTMTDHYIRSGRGTLMICSRNVIFLNVDISLLDIIVKTNPSP